MSRAQRTFTLRVSDNVIDLGTDRPGGEEHLREKTKVLLHAMKEPCTFLFLFVIHRSLIILGRRGELIDDYLARIVGIIQSEEVTSLFPVESGTKIGLLH